MKEKTIRLIAHRGSTSKYPENSIEAFLDAWNHQYQIETDVRCLSDGTLICMHDDTLERTTDANELFKKKPLLEISSKDLKMIHLQAQDGTLYEIPSFLDVLSLMKEDTHRHSVFDIKENAHLRSIIEMIQKENLTHQSMITTPFIEDCIEVKKRIPFLKTQVWLEGTEEQIAFSFERTLRIKEVDSILLVIEKEEESKHFPMHIPKHVLEELFDKSSLSQKEIGLFFSHYSKELFDELKEVGFSYFSFDALT